MKEKILEIQEACFGNGLSSQACGPMELCYGGKHVRLSLSATKRYTPEQIRAMCRKVVGPFHLVVQGSPIAIHGEECMLLACHACAAYHDWVAYNVPLDDGFEEDMAAREAIVQARWEEPISDNSDEGYCFPGAVTVTWTKAENPRRRGRQGVTKR